MNPARRLEALSLNKSADKAELLVGGSVSGQPASQPTEHVASEPRLRDRVLQVRGLVLLVMTSQPPSGAVPNVLRPEAARECRTLCRKATYLIFSSAAGIRFLTLSTKSFVTWTWRANGSSSACFWTLSPLLLHIPICKGVQSRLQPAHPGGCV